MTPPEDPRAVAVSFSDDMLIVRLEDDREVRAPLERFPALRDASHEDRANWRLIGGGIGLHCDTLDEDLSVPALLFS